MARDKLCGVYCIRNIENNKRYIGSSQDIHSRFRHHIRLLSRGIHDNDYLQRSWMKHGENCFVLEVVELCQQTDLSKREQHHIDILKVLDHSIGYNIAPLANVPPMTEETKRKIGLANKGNKPWTTGRHLPETTKDKIRKAVTANNQMRGKFGSSHQFFGKHHSDASKEKQRLAKLGHYDCNGCGKPVRQILDGATVSEYTSLAHAARETGVDGKNISQCLRGKRKHAGGFSWEYICSPND